MFAEVEGKRHERLRCSNDGRPEKKTRLHVNKVLVLVPMPVSTPKNILANLAHNDTDDTDSTEHNIKSSLTDTLRKIL